MECRIYTDSLTALMDSELAQEEVSIIERHLRVCESCAAEYRSLLYSYHLIEQIPQLDSSSELWSKIESRLQSPKQEKSGYFSFLFPKMWLPVGALSALVLFTASLFWLVPSHNRSEEMHQLLKNYMQEREREFAEKEAQVQVQGSESSIRFVQYNPFRDTARPKGNPFKTE